MVDPTLIALGVAAVAGVAIAAGYSYFTGEDATAGIDVDQDGEDDLSYTFEGAEDTHEDEPREFDVAPEDVRAIGTALHKITGIGDTRADDLKKAGFHTASDIYFAADDDLKEVSGIGDLTVSQIRDDIGSVDDEGNSEESDESGGKSDEEADETS